MEEERKNIELLIKIILYLLLALAFFSNYAIKSDPPNFTVVTTFLFGILALIFLYIGLCSKQDYLKVFGYVLAGSFILVFGWFILNVLTPPERGSKIVNLLKPDTIWIGLLIPSIICVLYMIIKYRDIKERKKKLT